MIFDPDTKIAVLSYYSNLIEQKIELFALWHSGLHRVDHLVTQWGDANPWVAEHSEEDHIVVTNVGLGAKITLRLIGLQLGVA